MIQNLSKTYPNGMPALNNVSLTIRNGLLGLPGLNEAGKSVRGRTGKTGAAALGPGFTALL